MHFGTIFLSVRRGGWPSLHMGAHVLSIQKATIGSARETKNTSGEPDADWETGTVMNWRHPKSRTQTARLGDT